MAKKSNPKPKAKPKTNTAKAKKTSGKLVFKKVLKYVGIAALVFVISSISGVIIYRFINPPVTMLMMNRAFEKLGKDGSAVVKRQWVPFDQIPQSMIDAVVASEDNKFVKHHGFDFGEMREAHRQNQKGKRLRGGSTITQQTCKNVFLWEGRSYVRKVLEAWFTVWVELLWNKQRIMEVYLNVIEMGNGIYGVGAAAQTYYHKPASNLSREESALLATVLPSPRKRNPARPTMYMIKRQQQILDLMNKIGKVEL